MIEDYSETIEFLDNLLYALKQDGRYEEYFDNPKNLQKLGILKKNINGIFGVMPDLD